MSDATIAGKTNAASPSQTSTTIDTLPNELLLATLGLLSVMERAKVRTVSKRWNNIVMDLGIHLEPLFVDDRLGVPFYSKDNEIALNVWCWHPEYNRLEQRLEDDLPPAKLGHAGSSESMYWRRSEFLTNPPISTLALEVIGPPGSPRQPMHAILRTATPTAKGSGGIRFGDLLDMFDKMRAYDTKLSLVGWRFVAWFATEIDGVGHDYFCERASTKSGIEVRKFIGKGA
jgi:hypothetical protein